MDRRTAKKVGWLTDEDYDFVYSRVPRFCVDLVVKNKKGEILYSLRKIEPYKGMWHLPGGRVNFRESMEKAVQRISLSELGLRVVSRKAVGYIEFFRERQQAHKRHSISLVFLVESKEGTETDFEQRQELKYFSKTPLNVHPVHAKFIKENRLA